MRRPLLPVVLIAASVTIATVSLPGGTAAQGIVKVVDARGIGIPAVRIELYGRAELLGTASTDPDGWADLTTRRWTELRRVTLRHLGYQTLVIAADQLDISRPISLHDAALSLDGLDVEVRGELCPTDDDPAGRALWQDAARRYSPDTGTRALHASYLFGAGPVMETALHRVNDEGLERLATTQTSRNERGIGVLESLVRRQGYSWRPPARRWGVRSLNRSYPSFELWHAYHFATTTFGDLHDFTVLRDRSGTTVLAFCPRRSSENGTRLMGTLEIDEDGRFSSARWRFLTDDPDENAGGEVEFATVREGSIRRPHLLGRRGIFYRHNGRESPFPDLPRSYYREAVADVSWQVLPPGR